MKTPLRYQISEYDCGPTAFLNAVSFLFEREQIPPELIRNVMLYSLDSYGTDGVSGKRGTSRTAMLFLSHWLDGFGSVGRLPVSSRYLSCSDVRFGATSELTDALRRGGAAVVRLMLDEEHYVTLTGIEGDTLLMFDPYYDDGAFAGSNIQAVADRPFSHNRIVPVSLLEHEDDGLYSLGRVEDREAVLIFNEEIKLTPEKSIEYFI